MVTVTGLGCLQQVFALMTELIEIRASREIGHDVSL